MAAAGDLGAGVGAGHREGLRAKCAAALAALEAFLPPALAVAPACLEEGAACGGAHADAPEVFVAPRGGRGSRSRCAYALRPAPGGAGAPRAAVEYVHWREGVGLVDAEDLDDVQCGAVAAAARRVAAAMPACAPRLLAHANAMRFLASTATGDVVVRAVLDPKARAAACGEDAVRAMRAECEALAATARLRGVLTAGLGGSGAAGEHLVGHDHVVETYTLADGRRLSYEHVEGFFSNPSAAACTFTLDWLCARARELRARAAERGARPGALLELYCGGGNHTVALAPFFSRVTGVELHPRLVEAAARNVRRNAAANASLGAAATNVEVVAAPSAKFCKRVLATKGKCLRKRAPEGEGEGDACAEEAYDTLLLDPPRAGLDALTARMATLFDVVLYVSCSPAHSLPRDLCVLCKTHEITRMCYIDHFPGSQHLETALMLERRRGRQVADADDVK